MTLFRSARKISRYLVRAKLCLLDRSFGSFKCGARRWQVCSNVTETETFTSSATNQTYKNNHEFNCCESSPIYLLMCKICSKQYLGQTNDIFRSRRNNCKFNDRMYLVGEPCMEEHILIERVTLVF